VLLALLCVLISAICNFTFSLYNCRFIFLSYNCSILFHVYNVYFTWFYRRVSGLRSLPLMFKIEIIRRDAWPPNAHLCNCIHLCTHPDFISGETSVKLAFTVGTWTEAQATTALSLSLAILIALGPVTKMKTESSPRHVFDKSLPYSRGQVRSSNVWLWLI